MKRRRLWSNLRHLHDVIDGPWAVFGDFNSILAPEEKRGGIQHSLTRSLDFINCIEDCELADAGFSGNAFTWCNGGRGRRIIRKRLDRVLIKENWSDLYQQTRIDHLARTGSDHSLIFMECNNTHTDFIR